MHGDRNVMPSHVLHVTKLHADDPLCGRVTATIKEMGGKLRAAGFENLVFEDSQDLLLEQLNAIHGRVLQPRSLRGLECYLLLVALRCLVC